MRLRRFLVALALLVPAAAAAAQADAGPGLAGRSVEALAGAKERIASLRSDVARAPEDLARTFAAARDALMSGPGVRGFTYFMILLFTAIAVEWLFWTYAYSPLRALRAAQADAPSAALRIGLRRLCLSASGLLLFIVAAVGASAALTWPPGAQEIALSVFLLVFALRLAWMLVSVTLSPARPDLRLVPVEPAQGRRLAAAAMTALGLLAFGRVLPGTLEHAAGAAHAGGAARFALYTTAAAVLVAASLLLFPRGAGAGRPLFPRSFVLALLVAGVHVTWLLHPASAGVAAIAAIVIALLIGLRPIVYFYWQDQPAQGAVPAIVLSLARFVTVLLGIGATAVALDTPLEALVESGHPLARVGLRLLGVAVLALLAHGVWIAVRSLVNQRMSRIAPAAPNEPPGAKSRLLTLLPLLRVTVAVLLLAMLVLSTLWALGVQIAPLLAGAGVVGLAIGFGAQTLVKDIVSGVFYLIDDAFRIGEYIQSGSFKGEVESFSLRSVKLRHHRGPVFTVPFGSLGAIQNMSRDWVIDKLTVGITYDSDIDKARKLVKRIGQELAADPELGRHILEPLKMQGVEQFGDFAIQIRMKMKTQPGQQFVIRRKAFAMLKKAFDENGIKFAFPTVQLAGGTEPGPAAAAAARQVLAREPPPAA
jgi:small-conductance mechanosensitive channel